DLASFWAKQGFAVYAFDLRGHGNSQSELDRERQFVAHFDSYRKDLDRFLDLVASKEPGIPLFLFGHSMGGAIVTEYILWRYPRARPSPGPKISGLILSGAALKLPGREAEYLAAAYKNSKADLPGGTELKAEGFSNDPNVVLELKGDDPLL